MSKKSKTASSAVFDSKKMLLSEESPFSIQEAYKFLRTNIAFSLPGNGCKCIGIVSANRGDGKSFIASNLAISLAQINKKVILIDCDLRLPTIAQKFGIMSVPGLSNYLSGGLEQIPVVHVAEKGIDIIPSGNIPPDSTTLISSREFIALIEELKQMYDYIVFDFPPICIVSDAVLLSDVIDGYLIVVRHEKSEIQMIETTIRQMKMTNAKILGFAYNGKNNSRKYYKKGKGYRYSKYYYKTYSSK